MVWSFPLSEAGSMPLPPDWFAWLSGVARFNFSCCAINSKENSFIIFSNQSETEKETKKKKKINFSRQTENYMSNNQEMQHRHRSLRQYWNGKSRHVRRNIKRTSTWEKNWEVITARGEREILLLESLGLILALIKMANPFLFMLLGGLDSNCCYMWKGYPWWVCFNNERKGFGHSWNRASICSHV